MPQASRKVLAQRHRERKAMMRELSGEPPLIEETLPALQQAIDGTQVFEPTDVEPPDLLSGQLEQGSRQVSMQPWRTALMMALKRRMAGKGNPQALHRIADSVVKMACAGDMNAIAEIGNRLDGKAVQPSEMTITNIRQVSDDELERRLAERIVQATALLVGPGGEGGSARADGGAEAAGGRRGGGGKRTCLRAGRLCVRSTLPLSRPTRP